MPTEYCRHILTNGRRCCSPAMRGKAFCYYHGRSHASHRSILPYWHKSKWSPDEPPIIHPINPERSHSGVTIQRAPLLSESVHGQPSFDQFSIEFPALEDRESIQLAISMLIGALGQDRIDAKRASTILYGLQVASANARNLNIGDRKTIRDSILDDTGQEIAPDEDPEEITEFHAWLEEQRAAEDEEDEDDEEDYFSRNLFSSRTVEADEEAEDVEEEDELDDNQEDEEESEDEEEVAEADEPATALLTPA